MIGAEFTQRGKVTEGIRGNQRIIYAINFRTGLWRGKRIMTRPYGIVPTPAIVVGTDMADLALGLWKGATLYGFRVLKYFWKGTRSQELIEEINSTQNKDARIQSLQPFVKNGYIKFSKKHKTLLKQMTEYPMGKNDDAPDGLQMAVKLALDVKIGRRVDYRSVIARALDFRRGAY